MHKPEYPTPEEHEACRIFGAIKEGKPNHAMVYRPLTAAAPRLVHGSFTSPDGSSHGSGVRIDQPLEWINHQMGLDGSRLGLIYLPKDITKIQRQGIIRALNRHARECGIEISKTQESAFTDTHMGTMAKHTMPIPMDVFFKQIAPLNKSPEEWEKDFAEKMFNLRQRMQKHAKKSGIDIHLISLNPHAITYRCLVAIDKLLPTWGILQDPKTKTRMIEMHARAATNTGTGHENTQPNKRTSHNGEFNSIPKGRVTMQQLERQLREGCVDLTLYKEGRSDSADMDAIVDFKCMQYAELGYKPDVALALALLTTITPVPTQRYIHKMTNHVAKHNGVSYPELLTFHRRHQGGLSSICGPGAILAHARNMHTASLQAIADGNALRPMDEAEVLLWNPEERTEERALLIASERRAILTLPGIRRVIRGRNFGPGSITIATADSRGHLEISADTQVHQRILQATQPLLLATIKDAKPKDLEPYTEKLEKMDPKTIKRLQIQTGWMKEHIILELPFAATHGKLRIHSQGNPYQRPDLREDILCTTFEALSQAFAQLTNPALEAGFEADMFSTSTYMGGRDYDPTVYAHSPIDHIRTDPPILSNQELLALKNMETCHHTTIDGTINAKKLIDAKSKIARLKEIAKSAADAVEFGGKTYLILSDKRAATDTRRIPLEPIEVLGAVIEELNKRSLRKECSIIVKTAAVKEGHDCYALINEGANSVNPYLMYEWAGHGVSYTPSIVQERVEIRPGEWILVGRKGVEGEDTITVDGETACANISKMLKDTFRGIMAKPGMNSTGGTRGSGKMEVVGLGPEITEFMAGFHPSREGGQTQEDRVAFLKQRHKWAQEGHTPSYANLPDVWLNRGTINGKKIGIERTLLSPMNKLLKDEAIQALDLFSQTFDIEKLDPTVAKKISDAFNQHTRVFGFLEGSAIMDSLDILQISTITADEHEAHPITANTLRIAKQALAMMGQSHMSRGAEQDWAFKAMAKASLALGQSGATGEGGMPKDLTDENRPRKIQVASGRFTSASELADARTMEINHKKGQGAKAGQGGFMPGPKVSQQVAEIRKCEPFKAVPSPANEHDTKSIEDEREKNKADKLLNPKARLSIKFVSGTGLGPIAVGGVMARHNLIETDNYRGGTGAAQWESIMHTGLPGEYTVEIIKYLAKNRLRHLAKTRFQGGLTNPISAMKANHLGFDETAFGSLWMVLTSDCNLQRTCQEGCTKDITHPFLQTKRDGTAVSNWRKFTAIENDPELKDQYITAMAKRGVIGMLYLALAQAKMFELLQKRHPELVNFSDIVNRRDLLQRRPKEELSNMARKIFTEADTTISPHEQEWLNMSPQQKEKELQEWLGTFEKELADQQESKWLKDCGKKGELPTIKHFTLDGDTAFGTATSGHLHRTQKNPHITFVTNGHAGNKFAYAAMNQTIIHTGTVEDNVAELADNGTKIAILRPKEYPKDFPLGSNVGCYGAKDVTFFLDSTFGQRMCILMAGTSTAMWRGGGDFACQFMLKGTAIMLPDPELMGTYSVVTGSLCAGMSGGQVFAWVNKGQNIKNHVDTEKFDLEIHELSDNPNLQSQLYKSMSRIQDIHPQVQEILEREMNFWKTNLSNDHGRIVSIKPKPTTVNPVKQQSQKIGLPVVSGVKQIIKH